MRKNCLLAFFIAFFSLSLTAYLQGECARGEDHRSNTNAGLKITDFTISGTEKLNSEELAGIASSFIGGCFDEDSDELKERVHILFQNKGYFAAEVQEIHVDVIAPLSTPKGVVLNAKVLEGPRYKLAGVTFKGNRAFSESILRSKFLFKKGDLFQRDRIASGFDGVLALYRSVGYLDITFIPDTKSLSNATVLVALTIREGPQYRMGKLEVFAKKEIADQLLGQWQLPEGAVFDSGYIDKFIAANRALLPLDFTRDGVQVVRNCPDSVVDVRIELDPMSPSWRPLPKDIKCERGQ